MSKSLHDELISKAVRWLNNRCGVVVREYDCYASEKPDAMGFRSDSSILIECKTSRSDFFRDRKKLPRRRVTRQMGNLRYYLVPDKLVLVNEVPEGWGLLYDQKRGLRIVLKAPWHNEPEIKVEENILLYSLVRRAVIRGYLQEFTTPENRAYVDERGN